MTFAEWLLNEMQRRDLSQSELARRAGLAQATISYVLSGERNPGPEFCLGIAKAMNIPPEVVFQEAGIFPPSSAETKNRKEADHLFSQLSDRQQNDVLTMMRALVEERYRGSSSNPATT
jgi:transcriptional regulator with XRE-family HTH domain